MNIQQRIESLEKYIEDSQKDLKLYREMQVVFNRLTFPEGMAVYFSRYTDPNEIYANFYPSYESENKDLTSFVHALARKFHVKFQKSKSYDKSTLEYLATIPFGQYKIITKIDGVIPKKCRVIETELPLTEEEIEAKRQEALSKIKTTRIEREIVCR